MQFIDKLSGSDVLLAHTSALQRQDTLPWSPGQEDVPRPVYTQPTHSARKPVAAMQAGDASPGSEEVPMPTCRPTGTQMDFQPQQTIPVSARQVSYGDKSLPARLSRATGVHTEPSMGQVDQMSPTDLTSRDMQSRPLPPGMELQSQHVIPLGTQCDEFCTPSVSTCFPRAAGTHVAPLQTHAESVDHKNNLTLPVGADAYIPACQDAQPVCVRLQDYAVAGIAERFRDNIQPPVGSTRPRPNEGVTQPAPSSTQPLYLAGTQTAVMQPENFRPSLQPSSVNAPMPVHRFDGVQVQQQYGLSEGTQRVQTMPNNYGIQHMLVHDDGSLALGRTQTYSAAFGAADESGAINLQSSVAAYGLGPSPNSNFSDRNGVLGPCGQSLRSPFPSYPAVTCGYSTMPYSNTQNGFIQNWHTVQNSNTRNSRELNLFSENNFH